MFLLLPIFAQCILKGPCAIKIHTANLLLIIWSIQSTKCRFYLFLLKKQYTRCYNFFAFKNYRKYLYNTYVHHKWFCIIFIIYTHKILTKYFIHIILRIIFYEVFLWLFESNYKFEIQPFYNMLLIFKFCVSRML